MKKRNFCKLLIAVVCVFALSAGIFVFGTLGVSADDTTSVTAPAAFIGDAEALTEVGAEYLTFSSENEFTLKTSNTSKNWDGTLFYSTDSNTWTEWNGEEIQSSNGRLYLRGEGNTVICKQETECFVLTGEAISCSGNIETLLDYNTVAAGEHPTMGEYAFTYLFKDNYALVSAPTLGADVLTKYCYEGMFTNCTSLESAPELPAKSLAICCYQEMFYGCTSLKTAPELPAETLANYCYHSMFYNCTSLETAPELPAKSLEAQCYHSMFYGCTSLKAAPELPAETLAIYCYAGMFKGCTALKSAPELPAAKLEKNCYVNMFNGCTSLEVPMQILPAVTLEELCYLSMFYNCTSLKTAPKISAESLARESCKTMFANCTSLEAIPELSATTMALYCYDGMFSGCTKLALSETQDTLYTTAWSLPSFTTGVVGWNQNMFQNTSGTFTGAPAAGTSYYLHAHGFESSDTCVCELAHSHDGGDTVARKWTVTGGDSAASGKYFLYEDIVLTDALDITENITLCLNGHTLDLNGYTINVKAGASLTISDCKGQGKIESSVQGTTDYFLIDNSGTFALESGNLNAQYGVIKNADGSETLISGGSIKSEAYHAIYNKNGGDIYLSGSPSVSGNRDICLDGGTVYAHAKGDGTAIYSGETIGIRLIGNTNTFGRVIVSGVSETNKDKFTMSSLYIEYMLALGKGENSSDLVCSYTFSGKGTEDDPYLVSNSSELQAAVNSIANGTNYVKLKNDIEFDSGMDIEHNASIDLDGKSLIVHDHSIYDYYAVEITIKNGSISANFIAPINIDNVGSVAYFEGLTISNTGDSNACIIIRYSTAYIRDCTIIAPGENSYALIVDGVEGANGVVIAENVVLEGKAGIYTSDSMYEHISVTLDGVLMSGEPTGTSYHTHIDKTGSCVCYFEGCGVELHVYSSDCDTVCDKNSEHTREVSASHTPETDDNDCSTALVCTVCGTELTAAKSHVYDNVCLDTTCNNEGCGVAQALSSHTPETDDNDCSTALVCTVCGEELVAAKSHIYDNVCLDTTCNNEGCKVAQVLSSHTYGEDNVCDACGYLDETETDEKDTDTDTDTDNETETETDKDTETDTSTETDNVGETGADGSDTTEPDTDIGNGDETETESDGVSNGDETETETETETDDPTNISVNGCGSGGCGSSVGVGAIALISVLVLGAATLRRKDDE